jgi:hypothetical protein
MESPLPIVNFPILNKFSNEESDCQIPKGETEEKKNPKLNQTKIFC